MTLRIAVLLLAVSFCTLVQAQDDAAREAAAITAEAERYAAGDGVPQSDAEALTLYREAAALGDARALFRLGEMHAEGRGVEADETAAVAYYREAMAKSYGPAVTSLGICYAEGKGVAADRATAAALLQQAAAAGDRRARDYIIRHRLTP